MSSWPVYSKKLWHKGVTVWFVHFETLQVVTVQSYLVTGTGTVQWMCYVFLFFMSNLIVTTQSCLHLSTIPYIIFGCTKFCVCQNHLPFTYVKQFYTIYFTQFILPNKKNTQMVQNISWYIFLYLICTLLMSLFWFQCFLLMNSTFVSSKYFCVIKYLIFSCENLCFFGGILLPIFKALSEFHDVNYGYSHV